MFCLCHRGFWFLENPLLANGMIDKHLAAKLNRARLHAGKHGKVDGLEYLDKVIDIDQSPIGRTPRSNPGTWTYRGI